MNRYMINTNSGFLCYVMAKDERSACKIARNTIGTKRELTATQVTVAQYLKDCRRAGFR